MEKKCRYKHSDIWLYVQNRMSREEETEFQYHLMHCRVCCEDLAHTRCMIRAIGKKQQRVPSFRGWIIAASLTCLASGTAAYWYHQAAGGDADAVSPGNVYEWRIDPPVVHDSRDSVAVVRDSCLNDSGLRDE
ncbi:hypothetical protein [uncultured Bacteroides sp.]|uniref:hypothetical protein n=1 Tax=uncultured Bacteroides sp. TaxID=162156 RepID=UPI0025EB5EA8|nr:hypothetical protein [uncultured Bacteroides sp.]